MAVDINEIAEIIDRLENNTASLNMPGLPAEIHVRALRETLPEITDELKQIYLRMGGEDHWG